MTTPKRITFKTELVLEVEVSADVYQRSETRLDPPETIVEITSVGIPNARGRWLDLELLVDESRWKELQEEALDHV